MHGKSRIISLAAGIFAMTLMMVACERTQTSGSTSSEAPTKAESSESVGRSEEEPAKAETTSSPAKSQASNPTYTVKLETTKGDIVIDVYEEWAPLGAKRFRELVKGGYYTDVAFFRVIKGFMAQVGISGDPAKNAEWRTKRIQDDPVVESNKRGMVTYAMAGPNTRTTQFFINFRDNGQLDGMGFAPFGRVRDMEVVDSIYDGYGEGAPRGNGPRQDLLQKQGNSYLRESFPNLDYIVKATIIDGE